MKTPIFSSHTTAATQRGVSLIVVMVILTIVSILGAAAFQMSVQGERGARNDRDLQMALQAANLALQDAHAEIFSRSNSRASSFAVDNDMAFASGCGTQADGAGRRGLCPEVPAGSSPSWLTVDLESDASTVPYGAFSNRQYKTLPDGVTGPQPAKAPRYVIERIYPTEQGANLQVEGGRQPGNDRAAWFRVTAMGFGPRTDILAVTQSVVRKPPGDLAAP